MCYTDSYGKYFGEFLGEADIDISKIWITNLYKYPTENNRPLTDREISTGKLELLYEIEYVNPILIIALGKQVMETLGSKLYQFVEYKRRPLFGMHHPGYINRIGGENKKEFIKKLKRIKKYER